MDNFLLKISFSMSTSIIGIILSVSMTLCNTFFSCEKVYVHTVEKLENELDILWNMCSSNKLPSEIVNFDAERDPIEVLSEELIAKELSVDVGFVTLAKPISKWWGKMGKDRTVTSDRREANVPVLHEENSSKKDNEAA